MQWEESAAVVQSGATLQGWRLPEAPADSGESGITQVRKQREGKEKTESLKYPHGKNTRYGLFQVLPYGVFLHPRNPYLLLSCSLKKKSCS